MADSRWKVVKDGWGSRTNFQASYGLGMTPEDLAEGDEILDAIMQRVDSGNSEEKNADTEPESAWVKGNRERYEAGGRSIMKEIVAAQLAEEYKFTPTGDPEIDIIAAMGLRDMKGDPEFSHMFESEESTSNNRGGSVAGKVGGTKSKRQQKRERQRERARKHKQQTDSTPASSLPRPPARPYPLSAKDREEESRHLNRFLRIGLVEPSVYLGPASTFVVNKQCLGCHQLKCACGKKDYERRWLVDYRLLNDVTANEASPFPSTYDLLFRAAGKEEYAKIDLALDYHQIRVREEDCHKTAFITSQGPYQWQVTPFGLKSAPATFQHMIDSVLAPVRDCCVAFMNDCIIWSTPTTSPAAAAKNAHESVISNTNRVLECLSSAGLRANLSKSRFHVREVDMLGHLISQEGVSTDPAKLQGIKDYAVPRTLTDVHTFLEFTSRYRDFAAGYAGLTIPLMDLTTKDAPDWIPNLPAPALAAFIAIKQLLARKVSLAVHDPAKPTQLFTEASTEVYSGAIKQDGKPLVFFSDIFDTTQRGWPTTDRELYACVAAHEKFPYFLRGSDVTWFTDHQAFESLRAALADCGRRIRWREKLDPFPFRIQCWKCKEMDMGGLTQDSSNDKYSGSRHPILRSDRFPDFQQAAPAKAAS